MLEEDHPGWILSSYCLAQFVSTLSLQQEMQSEGGEAVRLRSNHKYLSDFSDFTPKTKQQKKKHNRYVSVIRHLPTVIGVVRFSLIGHIQIRLIPPTWAFFTRQTVIWEREMNQTEDEKTREGETQTFYL